MRDDGLRFFSRVCNFGLAALWAIVLAGPSAAANLNNPPAAVEYFGTCDASAAIALGADHFVVGSDESNVLRIYRQGKTDAPIRSVDLNGFLKSSRKSPEADIEGAARIGDRIYWIASFGANHAGEPRPNRRRFFATDIQGSGDQVQLKPVGHPYEKLLSDMAKLPALKNENLHAAAKIAPKAAGGFNVEGLSARPDGSLLIGLRSPIPEGKALLVPLLNPQDVVQGAKAKLGEPIRLSLGGRGVRSVEYSSTLDKYLIIAGAASAGGEFQLYQWSGKATDDAQALTLAEDSSLNTLQPEALIFFPESADRVMIFSDDGTRLLGQKMCKEAEPSQQRFRVLWMSL